MCRKPSEFQLQPVHSLRRTHSDAQDAEAPQFDLLPSKRGKDGEGKAKKGRARRAKAPAKTLLPEDHHYNVSGLLVVVQLWVRLICMWS